MDGRLASITAGYRERISRIALFDPLFELTRKTGTDANGKSIDYFGLGLLTLLFFFENMLMRNRRVGVKALSEYLYATTHDQYDLDLPAYEKIAREIITTFRPPHGKKRARSFFNWETKQEEHIQYAILKADQFDPITNSQYYTLDEQGLELVFATKEYYSEFQLSIHQLVLRKQLEKGEFANALRQIDEMRVEVQNLHQRMVKMRHEIQRNIVSEETYTRYKKILEDVYLRLEREHDEFNELRSFVEATRQRLHYEAAADTEQRSYQYIVQIARELDEVHHEHRQLLQESVELKTTALQAAQESLYYVGIDSFNFSQEIVSRAVSSPLPVKALKGLAAPFLFVHHERTWSPWTVFAEQRLDDEQDEEMETGFIDVQAGEEEEKHHVYQRENFSKVMEIVLTALDGQEEITLKEVVDHLRQTDQEDVLQHRSFYDFWLYLHQYSPVSAKQADDTGSGLMDKALSLIPGKKIMVREAAEVLPVVSRYTIQNMHFKLEDV
ncbi:hypothetical protein CathTA2_1206 [Caldalkalibacillus thermarum TA2.A1]|uniref:Replicative DNA helicase n=1 Tax=Caldalkalibacillus thermarum (strain TA2.A1) TaxID=986075 RepID=F5L5Z3_CALTT|nr:hypothetical protein [Caldalkalibacillus thermarum]EGL83234.1 hypothetical protein CathTA2_1206 [Caldalkalibacillus thermarum TA2.A1]QZT35191.1 replicative DNA helicase [Caldalkalibacillus thermarum TA2.A1]